jgi:hypothetical protein
MKLDAMRLACEQSGRPFPGRGERVLWDIADGVFVVGKWLLIAAAVAFVAWGLLGGRFY